MAIQPSNPQTPGLKLALQFPEPPVLKSNAPADVKAYTEAVNQHLSTMNKVLVRTLQQIAVAIDTKQNKT